LISISIFNINIFKSKYVIFKLNINGIFDKEKEIKNTDNNKFETETNNKKNEFTKVYYQEKSEIKEFEVK